MDRNYKNQLYKKISETVGDARFSAFLKLCDIISFDKRIELTCKLLKSDLDYFERLLYTEQLKQLNKKINRPDLQEEINKNKTILNENINLIKKHSKIYCIINENNIKERLNRL